MIFKSFSLCRKIDIDYFLDYVEDYEEEFDVEVLVLLVNQQTYEELDGEINKEGKFHGYQLAIKPSLHYGQVEMVTNN